MKRILVVTLLAFSVLTLAVAAEAARVRVVRRAPRTRVVVHTGFPLRRPLPHVYVRAPRFAIRVTPRVFLPPVVFGAVVVPARPAPAALVWRDAEVLNRAEDWTEFTLSVDRRGTSLLLEIDKGPAEISFAEVVFDNGDAQVVDFNDRRHPQGLYTLLDFKDGRKIDHVRMVARAAAAKTEISLHLLT
jgi:hypothetical protein